MILKSTGVFEDCPDKFNILINNWSVLCFLQTDIILLVKLALLRIEELRE